MDAASSNPFEEFSTNSYLTARNRKKTTLTTSSPDPLDLFEHNEPAKFKGYVNPPVLLSSQSSRLKTPPCEIPKFSKPNQNTERTAPVVVPSERSISDRSQGCTEQDGISSHKLIDSGHDFYEDDTPVYCLDKERKSVEDAIERYTQARIYAHLRSFEDFLQERKSCRSASAEFPASDPVDSQVVTPQMVALTRDQALFRDSHGEDEVCLRRPRTAADRTAGRLDYSADADVCEELYDKRHAVSGEGYSCIPRIPHRNTWLDAAPAVPVTDGRDGQSISPAYIHLCSNNKFFGNRNKSADDDHFGAKDAVGKGKEEDEDDENDEQDEEDEEEEDDDDDETSSSDDDDEEEDEDDNDDDNDDGNSSHENSEREKLDIIQC